MVALFKPSVRRAVVVLSVALAMILLDGGGYLLPVDRLISDARTSTIEREAGGDILFLAIDKKSLDAMPVWPWPRETYARIIDALVAGGARDVFLDIDLSAASRPEADVALAGALDRAGGGVLLPTFVQSAKVDAAAGDLAANRPLPVFRDLSWMASVNVIADPDGIVRRYPFAVEIEGESVPSVAAFLSGVSGPAGASFEVNYAIAPDSVPAHSVIDLLDDRLDATTFDGKSVVVGAHAIELGDNFGVPVHGVLPGSLIHILASETLRQDLSIRTVNPPPWTALLAALLFAAGSLRGPVRFRHFLAGLVVAGLAIEILALGLLSGYAVLLPTAALQGLLIGVAVVMALHELDMREWLLLLARVDKENSKRVLERIFVDSSDAIVIVDGSGAMIEWSRSARRMFGGSGAFRAGMDMRRVLPPEIAADVMAAIEMSRRDAWSDPGMRVASVVAKGETLHLEYGVTPSRLSILRGRAVADDRIVASVVARDVTLRIRQEARIERMVRFDALTGALSRAELIERIDADLADAPVGATRAVIVLNLDRFRIINATLGRKVGDALLRAVATRLESGNRRSFSSGACRWTPFRALRPLRRRGRGRRADRGDPRRAGIRAFRAQKNDRPGWRACGRLGRGLRNRSGGAARRGRARARRGAQERRPRGRDFRSGFGHPAEAGAHGRDRPVVVDRQRRALCRLSAADPAGGHEPDRRGGARPVAPSGAWNDRSRRVHRPGRGKRVHR